MTYVEAYRNGWRCFLVLSEGRTQIRVLDIARLETARFTLDEWRAARPQPLDTPGHKLAIRLEKRVKLFRRCGNWGPGKPRKVVRKAIASLRDEVAA